MLADSLGPMKTWLVDAYNVIRRDPRLRAVEEERGTEAARLLLESQLRLLRAREGRGVTVAVAYDGTPPHGEGTSTVKGLRILYSGPGRSADDVILAEARRAEGRMQVKVVTSDLHDIARRLRGLRVEHVSVEEFTAELWKGSDRDRAAGAEKPEEVSGHDVDFWLREFGDSG